MLGHDAVAQPVVSLGLSKRSPSVHCALGVAFLICGQLAFLERRVFKAGEERGVAILAKVLPLVPRRENC